MTNFDDRSRSNRNFGVPPTLGEVPFMTLVRFCDIFEELWVTVNVIFRRES